MTVKFIKSVNSQGKEQAQEKGKERWAIHQLEDPRVSDDKAGNDKTSGNFY